ncbi:MAG: hypothetical protein KAI50_02015, partial [Desulfobacterales bacterium]|nr:hypothetical protein [Desulfobacterales bacterium]
NNCHCAAGFSHRLRSTGPARATDLAKQLEMSQPGVGYAENRGEKIAKENNYQLLIVSYLLIYGRPAYPATVCKPL